MQLPRSDAPRVSVIIPAFSKSELLLACLRSLQANVANQVPCEVIVVLIEANESVAESLARNVDGLTIVFSKANLGLPAAANRGRARASGEFLVLLHDDAEVQPGWLEALLAAAKDYPEAGAIGGKVLCPDGRLQDAGSILWKDASTSKCWTGPAPDPGSFDQIRAVDFCQSCSLLIRAAVWDAMGGLDERFYPAYFVDVDIGMSVRRLGGVVLYQPKSCIVHRGGSSTTRSFKTFLIQRNRQKFREKWERELEEHEPASGEDADSVARAIARAEARRRSASPTWPASSDRATHRARSVDDAVWLHKAEELQRDYIAHLESLVNGNPIPIYRLGTRLRFDLGGEGHRFAVAGSFYGPEPSCAWIGDEACHIFLPLAADDSRSSSAADATLQIEIEAFHLLGAHRIESPMRVTVNGIEILKVIERRHERLTYVAEIAWPAGNSRSHLDVCIESADPITPAEAQLGPDRRRLSIALVSLVVRSAE